MSERTEANIEDAQRRVRKNPWEALKALLLLINGGLADAGKAPPANEEKAER